MPTRSPDIDPADRLDSVISAAEEASERFTQAKTELLHRLADIDGAVLEIVQRVFDATPPEYQRTFHVHVDGGDEELTLPDFVRMLIERPDGTRATFTISVPENLYDDGEEVEDDADEEVVEEDEAEEEEPAPPPAPAPAPARGRARRPVAVDEEDDELGF